MPKAAIVVLAGTDSHADLGRATNALTTLQEFAEAGDDCTLIFDGGGVLWAAELLKEDHPLHGTFEKVRDHVAGACHFCAGAFGVRDQLEQREFALLRDHKGHPSLRGLVADGYAVITF